MKIRVGAISSAKHHITHRIHTITGSPYKTRLDKITDIGRLFTIHRLKDVRLVAEPGDIYYEHQAETQERRSVGKPLGEWEMEDGEIDNGVYDIYLAGRLMEDLGKFITTQGPIMRVTHQVFSLVLDDYFVTRVLDSLEEEVFEQVIMSVYSFDLDERFRKGLVRKAQVDLLHLALDVTVRNAVAFVLQFSLDRQMVPKCRVERPGGRKGELKLAQGQPGCLDLSSERGVGYRDYDVELQAMGKSMCRLVKFVVDLRSESTEMRILKYLQEDT
ncbi:hypothetical protein BJ508DRAFT_416521 [Ascobolus immersus RN42]|uniref:Uncharacterized protein n=1 Tax=Ascobolus immersus RN42 TaxID=1160509 RepID=A0A3N4HXY4_ASCIM|nr:hypothetical protein BJ508DRAFT_416521 [Ascobolus immersus RN42]